MILDSYINEYFRYYCDYKHIENIQPKPLKKLLKNSILKIYERYNTCPIFAEGNQFPTFEQIDIVLYILDIDEHYKSSYFLTLYEILFTKTDFDYILKNHAKQKQAQERVHLLLLNLMNHRKDVLTYAGLYPYKRVTRLGNCIKNNYIERVDRNLFYKLQS